MANLILGNVSMDSFVIDFTALAGETLAQGDPVELIGPQKPPDDDRAHGRHKRYQIFTRLGRRFQHVYIGLDES